MHFRNLFYPSQPEDSVFYIFRIFIEYKENKNSSYQKYILCINIFHAFINLVKHRVLIKKVFIKKTHIIFFDQIYP